MKASSDAEVDALLERSHALGSDPRITNYAGGNTSCKVASVDPVTGGEITLLWIKGSGGDLGTLTREGLAVLVLERLNALKDAYAGVDREDEMVPLIDHCRFGVSGAAPSIDTPLHAFVPYTHVDHLHPDAVIAIAASADGEMLTKKVFDDDVVWLPFRRPGWELGLECERAARDHPDARGIVLGGHGLMSWGETSEECRSNSLAIIERAAEFLNGKQADAFGPVVSDPLPDGERIARAAEIAPALRAAASADNRMVGRFDDAPEVLDFLAREKAPALVALGTSCPDHFLRTKVQPLFVDDVSRLDELHAAYRERYRAYYEMHREADSPTMRGADPAIVLVPGVGMFSFGRDAKAARIAGEYYVNAINVMRGAEAVSTYAPISEADKFRIEYWALEEAKLRRLPPPKPLTGKIALVVGGGSGIGRACAQRLSGEGAAVVVADRDGEAAVAVTSDLPDAIGLEVDVTDERSVSAMIADTARYFCGVDIVVQSAGLSIAKPVEATTLRDWDVQFDVLARGSFLVAREAAKVMAHLGGDIVVIVSKNAVVAGPANAAYGSAKAAQAHLVRLLAADLADKGIRVNGVNPDAVVRGSGIFAGDWGDDRARAYGVEREALGAFYADRTLLKQEIFPEDVAAAVFSLVGGDLSKTTGAIIPVDGGVPAAFLR